MEGRELETCLGPRLRLPPALLEVQTGHLGRAGRAEEEGCLAGKEGHATRRRWRKCLRMRPYECVVDGCRGGKKVEERGEKKGQGVFLYTAIDGLADGIDAVFRGEDAGRRRERGGERGERDERKERERAEG